MLGSIGLGGGFEGVPDPGVVGLPGFVGVTGFVVGAGALIVKKKLLSFNARILSSRLACYKYLCALLNGRLIKSTNAATQSLVETLQILRP